MARLDKISETGAGGGAAAAWTRTAARAVNKVVNKAGEKASTKIGQEAGKKTAATTKAPKYPSAQGKKVSTKVEGKVTTTSSSGRKTSKPAKSVEYTKKPPSEKQRLGSAQAQETKRVKTIVNAASTAKSASQKIVGKEVAKKNIYKAAAAGLAASEILEKKKGKK